MAGLYYFDTSAYVAVLLKEPGWERVESLTRGGEWYSSVVLGLEAHRTLVNLVRSGKLPRQAYAGTLRRLTRDLEAFSLFEVGQDLCGPDPMPGIVTPRSLDLLHLRTALRAHRDQPWTQFVSLDKNQLDAAMELGLPV